MPFINISTAGATLSDAQKQQLFNETTRLMDEVLHKNAELTSVRIDEFPASSWAVARQSMATRGQTAVHMDIKVTKGTNSDEEKKRMIALGMDMLKSIIGSPPEASYIVIHDIDGGSWGYDGQTQQARAGK